MQFLKNRLICCPQALYSVILYRNQDLIRRHQDLVEVLDILVEENDLKKEQQESVCDGGEAAQHDPQEQGEDSGAFVERPINDLVELQKAKVAASAKAIGSFSFLYASYWGQCW